jgi:hypothetical protein
MSVRDSSIHLTTLIVRGRYFCSRLLRLAFLPTAAVLVATANVGGCLEQPLEAIVREVGGGSGYAGETGNNSGGRLGDWGGGNSGGTSNPACVAYGANCSETAPCCLGTCDYGLCKESVPVCLREGKACTASSPCCIGDCGSDGFCPRLDCLQSELDCGVDEECCTHQCTDGKCTPLDGCHPLGERCQWDFDCCSYNCRYDEWSKDFRCMAASPCLSSGEVCGETLTDCCGKQAGKADQMCALDDNSSVNRCTPRSDECTPDGGMCAHAAECCGDYCLPNDGGWRACSSLCAELGERCEQRADCCGDGECTHGACVAPAIQCLALGAPCEESSQCCEWNCEPSTQLCSQPPDR